MTKQNLKLRTCCNLHWHPLKCSISLTKYVQDPYKKHYKTLMKGIKKELNKWTDNPVHG